MVKEEKFRPKSRVILIEKSVSYPGALERGMTLSRMRELIGSWQNTYEKGNIFKSCQAPRAMSTLNCMPIGLYILCSQLKFSQHTHRKQCLKAHIQRPPLGYLEK